MMIYRTLNLLLQFQQLRKAQITIAKHLRCFLVRLSLPHKCYILLTIVIPISMYIQAWRSYNNIRNATIVIQSYYRGWVAREEYRRMKYIKQATWAAGIIRKYFYGWKARKEV